MMIKKYLSERRLVWFTLILGILVLSAIPLIRLIGYDNVLPGEEPYYHARMAETITEKGVPAYDELSYGGREYVLQPYHILLAGASYLFGVEFSSRALPFVLGVISLMLFYLILRRLGLDLEKRLLIVCILVLSPIFIYTFSFSTPYCAFVFISLLGVYFYASNKNLLAALLLFSIIPFFGVAESIAIIAILFSYAWMEKGWKKFLLVSTVMILVGASYYSAFYGHYGLANNLDFYKASKLQQFLSDLGSANGFGVFGLMLGVFGIASLWSTRKTPIAVFIALFAASAFYSSLFFCMNFILAILAGYGFISLADRKWEIELLKEFAVIILICGILFSGLSYIDRSFSAEPDKDMIEGIEYLKESSSDTDVVLSHYKNGFWIEYEAGRKVVMDSLFEYAPNPNERFADSSNIFDSRDLKELSPLLDKYNITIIFVTPEMKKGLVWSTDEQGILFLLKNNEKFRLFYSYEGIEIWRYEHDRE